MWQDGENIDAPLFLTEHGGDKKQAVNCRVREKVHVTEIGQGWLGALAQEGGQSATGFPFQTARSICDKIRLDLL